VWKRLVVEPRGIEEVGVFAPVGREDVARNGDGREEMKQGRC